MYGHDHPTARIQLRQSHNRHNDKRTHTNQRNGNAHVTHNLQAQIINHRQHATHTHQKQKPPCHTHILPPIPSAPIVVTDKQSHHILQKQHRINGIIRRAGHPTQIPHEQTGIGPKGLLHPGHATRGFGVRAAQFRRDQRFGHAPEQWREEESHNGEEGSSGTYRRFNAKGSTRNVIKYKNRQRQNPQIGDVRRSTSVITIVVRHAHPRDAFPTVIVVIIVPDGVIETTNERGLFLSDVNDFHLVNDTH
mmetsp:Transcript_1608/g.2051  ORF Transcript_1608/g.2051 Transcript_1608/m.2051 type:complete len:249 (-) Transcript_1608:633-1379(-)